MKKHPTFAVVGHPNKGKSSIVSSLSLDDSVAISNVPGTTHKKRSFPLKVDGVIIYELFDTPGFQRARHVLAWLQKHEVSADKKHEVVRDFVNQHRNNPKFHDEIELLEPILDGAGIIYVVDASKPYSSEYEAEMEILRWCNQPSMALINHINDDDYTQEWKRALGHYFKLIRTYNPMRATFKEHIKVLESMAHLNEEWMQSIETSIELFKTYHQQMLDNVAQTITQLIYDSLKTVEKLPIKGKKAEEKELLLLQERFKESLRRKEQQAYKKIAATLNHKHLDKKIFSFPFEDIDLFSKESASIFGLTKKQLVFTTTTSMAAAGASIDLLLAGHTGFLGAAIGGAVGGVGGYFGFEKLFTIKVLGKSMGHRYLQISMENKNFPYILLNRVLFYSHKLLEHSHAKRDMFVLDKQSPQQLQLLNEKERRELEKYHKIFRSKKEVKEKQLLEYKALILEFLNK
jgi:GTPase Era involved in 16S rRNA processing